MTFTEIKQAILDYTLLTSTDAQTRIGKAINRHYRRITASLGLDAARFVTRSASASIGVQTVTFAEIEKIDRVLDTTDSAAIRLLQEVSIHQIRSNQPASGQPGSWAFQNADADSATILLDTVPQVAYSLQADGWTTLADLSGTDEPVFPESYHDVLVWFVVHEELLKKEKDKLAATYAAKAEATLRDLRFFLADSHTHETQQATGLAPGGSTAGGGGTGTQGGTSYTQSGLLTFDRGAGIVPFAVARTDAPYVVNLGAEFLGNVTTDRLIGRDTAGTGESEQLTVGGGLEFTGSGGIQVAADGVTYAKIQNVSAASKLLGRGSAAGSGDVEEITLGTGLSMSGTTLNGSGAAGSDTQVQFNDGGTALGGDAGLTYNKTTDALTIAGDLVFSATTSVVRSNTADASDTKSLQLTGGGAVGSTRGAYLILNGNEAGAPGTLQLLPGNVASAVIQFYRSDGTVAVSVDGATGLLTLAYGQIKFPATQNASTDANTLDDYEEGTWTPVLGGSGGTSGQTYSIQAGVYLKVGQFVLASYQILLSAKGTITTNAQVQGLPFTSSSGNLNQIAALSYATLGTNWVNVVTVLGPSATAAGLQGAGAAGVSNNTALVAADIANTTLLNGTIVYRASA